MVNLTDPRFEPDEKVCEYRCRCGEYMSPLFEDVYVYGIYTLEVPVWKCVPCDTTRILLKNNLRYKDNTVYREVQHLRDSGIKQITYKDLLSVICTEKH